MLRMSRAFVLSSGGDAKLTIPPPLPSPGRGYPDVLPRISQYTLWLRPPVGVNDLRLILPLPPLRRLVCRIATRRLPPPWAGTRSRSSASPAAVASVAHIIRRPINDSYHLAPFDSRAFSSLYVTSVSISALCSFIRSFMTPCSAV